MQIEHLSEITPTELTAIMTIWLDGNLDAHSFIDGDYWRQHQSEVQSQIKEAEIYVARDEGEIVGFAGMVDRYLAGIFVKTGYRDDGIGSLLLFALEADYQLIKLDVFEANQKAVHFYDQHGFSLSKTHTDPELNVTELTMKWQA